MPVFACHNKSPRRLWLIVAGKLETDHLGGSPFHCRAHASFQDLLLDIFTLFPVGLPLHSVDSSAYCSLLLLPQGQEVVGNDSKSTERKVPLDGLERDWRLDNKPEGRGRGRPLNPESVHQPQGKGGLWN